MTAKVRIIAWNVRGLNCPLKRGSVRWVLRKYSCDIAILLESKLEEVSREIILSLWGRPQVKWIFLPSVGRSGGIIIILDTQLVELVDSRVRVYSVCCILRSIEDNFIWGLIGIYGPNDDALRVDLWEELPSFLSCWDIPWCLGGDLMWLGSRLRGQLEAD